MLLTGIALVIGLTRDDDDGADTTADPVDSTSSTPSAPVEATVEGMEAFIGDYLSLVTKDPEAAFDMLTPDFQEASNGIEGYRGFWDTVSSTKLRSVDADPESLVVDYRYTYVVRGDGPRTEDVSLQLDFTDDGEYLIAGEA